MSQRVSVLHLKLSYSLFYSCKKSTIYFESGNSIYSVGCDILSPLPLNMLCIPWYTTSQVQTDHCIEPRVTKNEQISSKQCPLCFTMSRCSRRAWTASRRSSGPLAVRAWTPRTDERTRRAWGVRAHRPAPPRWGWPPWGRRCGQSTPADDWGVGSIPGSRYWCTPRPSAGEFCTAPAIKGKTTSF